MFSVPVRLQDNTAKCQAFQVLVVSYPRIRRCFHNRRAEALSSPKDEGATVICDFGSDLYHLKGGDNKEMLALDQLLSSARHALSLPNKDSHTLSSLRLSSCTGSISTKSSDNLLQSIHHSCDKRFSSQSDDYMLLRSRFSVPIKCFCDF